MGFYSDRVFPALLAMASSHFDDDRRALLARARGRVLELGVGTGANLGFYGPDVSEVVAIDLHRAVLKRAEKTLQDLTEEGRIPYQVRLQEADAQALPFDDASFDTVVAFLTLCSVDDVDAAAREMRRVLRPGGRLLVLEHVRAEQGSRTGKWQDRLDPFWQKVAVGCHLNRDTASILDAAGFDVSTLESYREPHTFPTSPRIRGMVSG